jgi:hypothetical protein
MLEKRPGDEYQEWEYPDPKDVEELDDLLEDDDPESRRESRLPSLRQTIVGIVLLTFVGSLLLPFLPSLGQGQGAAEQVDVPPATGNTAEEFRIYDEWIESNVYAGLREWGATDRVQYLGVQFNDSIQYPVIGLQVEALDPEGGAGVPMLQSYSIEIFDRVFGDERARSVVLAWFRPAAAGGDSPGLEEVMLVGMLSQTAQGIDWANLSAEDLRGVADLYRDILSGSGESSLG